MSFDICVHIHSLPHSQANKKISSAPMYEKGENEIYPILWVAR